MGDVWDYKLRKMEIAWELATRVIPQDPTPTGKWVETSFMKSAQATLQEAFSIADAVFTEDSQRPPRRGVSLEGKS